MAGKEAFQVEGRVIEARPNHTFCVELANGHRLTAFVAGRAKQLPGRSGAGRHGEIAVGALRFIRGADFIGKRNDFEA